jgi:sugar phosphate permease
MGSRKTLACVLLGSGLSMLTLGSWNSIEVMCILLLLNGAFQSLAWGNCVKSLSATFEPSQHNKIIGIFSTSSFAGGVLASALAVRLLDIGGWKSMFFIPSVLVMGAGVLVFLGLHDTAPRPTLETGKPAAPVALTIRQLLAIRMLPEVTMCFLFVKLVRYAFFMWLPMYLHHALAYTESDAGLVAAMFDVGGVVGSACLGFLIDNYFHKKDVAASAAVLFLCTASLVLFSLTSTWGKPVNCFFILIAGATNCGVDPILSGTLPIKFAALIQNQVYHSPLSHPRDTTRPPRSPASSTALRRWGRCWRACWWASLRTRLGGTPSSTASPSCASCPLLFSSGQLASSALRRKHCYYYCVVVVCSIYDQTNLRKT